jgi:protein ImuB
MPLSEAKSLLARGGKKRSPAGESGQSAFYTLCHDPAADLSALEKLADDCDRFSPIVGLQQDTPQPDCIFLEITGLSPLFGGETELARAVEFFCRRQGYLPRLAIAPTLGLAQALAQFKVASLQTVDDDDGLAAYGDLPVAALRLEPWIVDRLHQLGVLRVEQLLRLPRPDLSARFGPQIYQRIDQLTGDVAEPIQVRRREAEFFGEQRFDSPIGDRETMEVVLQRLVGKICGELAAKQQGALQWTIRLYNQHRLPLKLQVNLFQPTATAEHVMQLVGMQLEQELQPRVSRAKKRRVTATLREGGQPLEVHEICVTVSSAVLLVQRQRELFDENPRLDRQSLARLINCLSSRLGRQHVLYPSLVSTAQPECAFAMQPLVDPHSREKNRPAKSVARAASHSHVLARPLKLFQPALPLPAVSIAQLSELHCESASPAERPSQPVVPPLLLIVGGMRQRVTRQWGPERIETGWWRGPMIRRDYWRVETSSHQQFWIYHDLKSKTWFLHGEF